MRLIYLGSGPDDLSVNPALRNKYAGVTICWDIGFSSGLLLKQLIKLFQGISLFQAVNIQQLSNKVRRTRIKSVLSHLSISQSASVV